MELDFNGASYSTLSARLQSLHDMLLLVHPDIERVACALYDPGEDLLKTFINSTRNGYAIRGYQYHLSESQSLSQLARSNETRVIEDIPAALKSDTAHSRYVLDHLPPMGDPSRAQLLLYRGGHMFYTNEESRKAFSADAKAFYQSTQ